MLRTTKESRRLFRRIAFSFLLVQSVGAIPRFAIKEGASCNTCHVNPAGGALRNDYGMLITSADELPMSKTSSLITLDDMGQLTDHLRIGADLRIQAITDRNESTTFPMQTDLYAYFDLKGMIGFYVESEVLRENTEYWTNASFPFLNGYVRVGRMRPMYGLMLDDHTSFIRGGNLQRTHGLLKEGLPFSPLTPPVNTAELGMFRSDFLFTASLSNGFLAGEAAKATFLGPPSNRTAVIRAEYSSSRGDYSGVAGAAYLSEGDTEIKGFFGGVSRDRLTWTGEVDFARGWTGDVNSVASYNEIAWLIKPGIHLLAKYDFFDEDIELLENALSRFSLGTELYVFSFLELKIQIRKTHVSGIGMTPIEFLFQTHVWF